MACQRAERILDLGLILRRVRGRVASSCSTFRVVFWDLAASAGLLSAVRWLRETRAKRKSSLV
jgi:hypothetical protein